MIKTLRIPILIAGRKYVDQRDNYQCQSCVKPENLALLSIDHIIPLALGGSNDISKRQTLCLSCNRRKKEDLVPCFRRYCQ